MKEKVIVILRDNSQVTLADWQKLYGLPVDSDMIGKYFSLQESRFVTDLNLYGCLIVNELLIYVLDGFREAIGKPIKLNSFNRSEEHQLALKEQGLKTALVSPHVAKMAADIDTLSPAQTREWVKILKEVSKQLDIAIRIGYEQYLAAGSTFIHVDVCPEYYATGKTRHAATHPQQWEHQITW